MKVGQQFLDIPYVQEVVTQPKMLSRNIISNLIHVTKNYFTL